MRPVLHGLGSSVLFALLATSAQAQPIITTVAGGGPHDTPALDTAIPTPIGIARDSAGNLYVALGYRNQVYRIDPAGRVFVAAGSGVSGFGGDGGPATSAQMDDPFGIAVDEAGNIYIGDVNNHRIRRVDAVTGIITTFAGNGAVADTGDGGPAASASLGFPIGMAAGPGVLYFSDVFDHVVRRIDLSTGVIRRYAGNGQLGFSGDNGTAIFASLSYPRGIALNAAGDLYIADSGNQRVRVVPLARPILATVAGNGVAATTGDGGPATSASLFIPWTVTLDAAGNLFISQEGDSRIRRVDGSTGTIDTAAGAQAFLSTVFGMTADGSGGILLTDYYNNLIKRLDPGTGIVDVFAGTGESSFNGDGIPALNADLFGIRDVALDATRGILYVADSVGNRVRRIDLGSGVIDTVAGDGRIGFNGDGGPATGTSLYSPLGVAVDASGNIFISDTFNQRIRRVDAATGLISTVAGTGVPGFNGDGGPATSSLIGNPVGIAVDAAGNLFFAEQSNNRIRRVDATTGKISTVAGSGLQGYPNDGSADTGLATMANLNNPVEVAVDSQGFVHFADYNHVVLKILHNGHLARVAGNREAGFSGDGGPATSARISEAFGLALDGAGNLLLTDTANARVRRVDAASGIITTIAGTGNLVASGDGGPAIAAGLSAQAVAPTPSGNYYVCDGVNGRVRKVTSAGAGGSILVGLDPAVLWPPSHQLVAVTALVTTPDACSASSLFLASVTSSEPDDAPGGGDGNTTGDIQGADTGAADFAFGLSAERDASGSGRIYTVTYSAVDCSGTTLSGSATAIVPHDQGGVVNPLTVGIAETSSGTVLTWNPIAVAHHYNVIRGTIGSLTMGPAAIDLGAVSCIDSGSKNTSTSGRADRDVPPAGHGYFYLVEYHDGLRGGSYGSEEVMKPRVPASGACP